MKTTIELNEIDVKSLRRVAEYLESERQDFRENPAANHIWRDICVLWEKVNRAENELAPNKLEPGQWYQDQRTMIYHMGSSLESAACKAINPWPRDWRDHMKAVDKPRDRQDWERD